MKNVVSVQSLSTSLTDSDVVILDCSVDVVTGEDGKAVYRSGIDLFRESHIPGARYVDLLHTLSDKDSPYLFALPDPEVFRDAMQNLGVGDDKTVVLYDRSFTAWAARVWWMLRWIGFDNAMILDGGLDAWAAEHDTTKGDPNKGATMVLSLHLRPDVIVDANDVRSAINKSDVSLIDTLSEENFTGKTDSFARPGHILGAQNVFTLSHFENGHFKSEADLVKAFHADRDLRHITYCGAGILASASAFILVQLGYKDVALYAASLQQWASDPENSMGV